MLVRPLSTVDNTRDYACVSHSRQWSNYNMYFCIVSCTVSLHRTKIPELVTVKIVVEELN